MFEGFVKKLVGLKKFKSTCSSTDNLTELFALINSGNERGVNELLRRGIDISLVSAGIGRRTPLHIAVNNNSIGIVRCLLEHVDQHLVARERFEFIDARTTFASGNTAIHIAASNGSLMAVKVLLEYGAAYNIRNEQGKTPRDLTKDQPTKSFLKLVDVIFNEVRKGNFIVINKLGELKEDELFVVMNARNEQGYTLEKTWEKSRDKVLSTRLAMLIGRKYREMGARLFLKKSRSVTDQWTLIG